MSGIEWYEISGAPSDEERAVVIAALEQYLLSEANSPGPSWAELAVTRPAPEPAHGWSGGGSWSGLVAGP